MLEHGQSAPDFSLPDQDERVWSLSDLLVNGPIVLYFYPGDFTPICTKQACTFRDDYQQLTDAGLRVVGVSPQSSASHRKFIDRYDLPFILLADTEKEVTGDYGARGVLGLLTRRVSYFIDAGGVVRDRVCADLRLGAHRAFLERVRRSVGEVG